jgi:hypothetical protein
MSGLIHVDLLEFGVPLLQFLQLLEQLLFPLLEAFLIKGIQINVEYRVSIAEVRTSLSALDTHVSPRHAPQDHTKLN